MQKLSDVAPRKFISHLGMILVGVVSVMLLALLVAAFSAAIERGGRESALALQFSSVYAATPGGQGKAIFEEKCQACHNIGGGSLVGPDLKGVTSHRDRDWLINFITSPDQLIADGDPLANQLVQEYGTAMPNLGLSEEEAEGTLLYIEERSASQPSSSQAETTDTTGDAAKGRDIFTGNIPLENGGAACISCHNVDGIAALGGGAVAKDLTRSYSDMGEVGLASVLKTAPYPLMQAIYEARPLEDDEVVNLVAFLGETGDTEQLMSGQSPLIFILIGIAGLLLIAIILQTIWRGRISGVRQALVKGGSK